ncbi:CaiB/BaiF CoA transferase family protein [Paraburkholderia sp. IW21]|uniref:CaiB/BaiF CoA transferase family protein n=1 Tax=Paraburkholderia sp. IW21 TaxID=3242488 RepID=UPI003520A587
MDTNHSVEDRTGALADIKVLELGSMLAGPFVGTMLADFGAQVIKVEKPGKPDALREWPPHKDGEPLWWKSMARGKRLITLDISQAQGREIVLDLLDQTDIVIENFRPGTLERWGLSPVELATRFPELIWVRVSGYGQTGPMAQRGGYATIAEGFSGLASFTGFPDNGPSVSSFPMGDYLAGIFGAFGALTAVHHRSRTGRGQVVDVSLYEPLLRIIESVVLRYDQTGEKKPLLGNQMEEDVPRNIYRTADSGFVAISCGSQRIFENLARAMQRPDLCDDPRFATMAMRVANRDAIDAQVAAWIRARTLDAVTATLDAHEVVSGPILDIAAVLQNPHILARQSISHVAHSDGQMLRMPAPVPRLSETPGEIRWPGKTAGADNDAVFSGLLGMPPGRVQQLHNLGVI